MTEVPVIGFPTRGDLLQFLFKASGVMPEKRDQAPGFDDAKRKRLQKSLKRLADEDGDFPDNFNDLIRELSFLMAGYVLNRPGF